MDGQGNAANQLPYGAYVNDAYPLNQVAPASVMGVQPSQFTGNQLPPHQLSYQQIQQQQNRDLEQQLQTFWANQYRDIENLCDFRNQSLPLARIKKIMKSDEDVRMISAEAPVIFARACEMFILELTLRSWNQTEENRRRTLQRNDISTAIARTDLFDFLIDIVPRDEDVLAGIPRGTVPVAAASPDAIPYYPIDTANQYTPHVGSSHGMMMWPQNAYANNPGQPYMPAGPVMWPQNPQPGHPSSSGN